MRTEKELWEVVLSRPDLFRLGLCVWLTRCIDNHLISGKEYLFIDAKLESLRVNSKVYWIGEIDKLQPRIDWIKNRIEQL